MIHTLFDKATGRIHARVFAQTDAALACYVNEEVGAVAGSFDRTTQRINPTTLAAEDWTQPRDIGSEWRAVREHRNALVNADLWTVSLASPLSADCQASFVAYFAKLNRITIDFTDPAEIAWPDRPRLAYP